MDLRKRVFGAMQEGASSPEVAEQFGVSESFARKLRLRFGRFGTLEPAPKKAGRKPEFLLEHQEKLEAIVQERPDATNVELSEELAKVVGRLFSAPVISRALKRLGWTRKKKSLPRQRATARRRSTSAQAVARSGPRLAGRPTAVL